MMTPMTKFLLLFNICDVTNKSSLYHGAVPSSAADPIHNSAANAVPSSAVDKDVD
jgi:hypothetical protein